MATIGRDSSWRAARSSRKNTPRTSCYTRSDRHVFLLCVHLASCATSTRIRQCPRHSQFIDGNFISTGAVIEHVLW